MRYAIKEDGFYWAAMPKSIEEARRIVFRDMATTYRITKKLRSRTFNVYGTKDETLPIGKYPLIGKLSLDGKTGRLYWSPKSSAKKYAVNRDGEIRRV